MRSTGKAGIQNEPFVPGVLMELVLHFELEVLNLICLRETCSI